MTPWSYSRLEKYETCPKQYHALNVEKSVKEEKSDQQNDGLEQHKALEVRVSKNKPLPARMQRHETHLQLLLQAPGEKLTELKMALNEQFKPVGWFAPDVWVRAIADLVTLNGTSMMVDYKTGKVKDDFTQLDLSATVFMMSYPVVEVVHEVFWWLAADKITWRPTPLRREEIPWSWSQIQPRVDRYQEAHVKFNFPPRPGWACKYCPVKSCPYWERK